jgi:hypothetical protein
MDSTNADKLQIVMCVMDDFMDGPEDEWRFAGDVTIHNDILCVFCETSEGQIFQFTMSEEPYAVTVDSLEAKGGVFNETLTNAVRSLT